MDEGDDVSHFQKVNFAKLTESWGRLGETQSLKEFPRFRLGLLISEGPLQGEWRALRTEVCESLQGRGRIGNPGVDELPLGILQKSARSLVPSLGTQSPCGRDGDREVAGNQGKDVMGK